MDSLTAAEYLCDLLSEAECMNITDLTKEAICKARYETMCKNSPIQMYKCQVPIIFSPQSGIQTFYVDTCLQNEIVELVRRCGVNTIGSCCGHGVKQGYIQVAKHSVPKMLELGYRQIPLDNSGNGENCFYPKSILYKVSENEK